MRFVLTLFAIAALQLMQIGAAPAYAAPPDLEAEAAAKVTHLWIEFAQAHPDEQILSSEQEWESALRPTLEKIVEAELTGETIPRSELKSATNGVLDLIRWDNIFNKIKNLPRLIKSTARLKGVGMAAALSITISAEISVPIIVTALGHPGLAMFSPCIPYNVIGLAIASITQKYRLRGEMIELLGGEEPYQEFIDQQKILRKSLNLKSPKDLLFPIKGLDGKYGAAVISESSLFGTALEKIGFSEKQLTFSNLKKFCVKTGVARQYAQDLEDLAGLSEQLKTINLLSHLQAQVPDVTIRKLRETFSSRFVELKDLGNAQEFVQFRSWAVKISRATSPAEAFEILKTVPEGSSPALVAKVWEEIALPNLALTAPEVSYSDFRHLVKRFTPISVSCNQATTTWDGSWLNRFRTYVEEATHAKCGSLLDAPVEILD